MRKRDALRMALKLPRLPKLEEWEKLLYAGAALLFSFALSGATLVVRTKNPAWGILIAIGFAIYIWFSRASFIAYTDCGEADESG